MIILTLLLVQFLFFQGIRAKYNHWAEGKRTGVKRDQAPKRKGLLSWFRRNKSEDDGDDEGELLEDIPEDTYVAPSETGGSVEEGEETAQPPITIAMEPEEAPAPPMPKPAPIVHRSQAGDGVDMVVMDNRSMQDEVTSAELRAKQLVEEQGEYDPTLELASFEMPSADLLKKYEQQNEEIDTEEIEENKRLITTTLESFRIGIKSISATVGPAITLYEVVPEEGIHISRIRGLEDNISMSLSAMGIRIIAPMPGKGTIGMEAVSYTHLPRPYSSPPPHVLQGIP